MKKPDYLGKSRPKNTGPDYLKNKKTGVDWQQHEKDVEERSSGKRRARSGAAPGYPGDTKDSLFLRECKATSGSGITVKSNWLTKIAAEALAIGKVPIIEIRLDGQVLPTPKDWVLIPSIEFDALIEKIQNV